MIVFGIIMPRKLPNDFDPSSGGPEMESQTASFSQSPQSLQFFFTSSIVRKIYSPSYHDLLLLPVLYDSHGLFLSASFQTRNSQRIDSLNKGNSVFFVQSFPK